MQPRECASGAGAIEIEGLGFRYGEETPFLYRGLNLTIPAGAALGIVGDNTELQAVAKDADARLRRALTTLEVEARS